MIRALSCVIIVSFSAFSCTKPQPIPKNLVLAHVGDKTITIQDFIRRAEYSIRPAYCRQSNYVHKKIVLNSLIAEKLAALEMKKNEDELLASSHFKSFLKGRKEQAMRQVFYHDEFYDLEIDPRERENRVHDTGYEDEIKSLSQRLDTHFSKYEVAGCSGREINLVPRCNPGHSPWEK